MSGSASTIYNGIRDELERFDSGSDSSRFRRRSGRAAGRRRVRLAQGAAPARFCGHEGRLDRRQPLRREGHRRRRLGHHYRLCRTNSTTCWSFRWAYRCWRSSTGGGRWRRHRRHSSAIQSGISRPRALPAQMARRPRHSYRGAAECGRAQTVLVGTIEYHVAGEVRPSVHTTPESRDLYELMAEGVSAGPPSW